MFFKVQRVWYIYMDCYFVFLNIWNYKKMQTPLKTGYLYDTRNNSVKSQQTITFCEVFE